MKKNFNLSDFIRDENKVKFQFNRRNLSAENPTTSANLDISKKAHAMNDFFDSDLSDEEVTSDEEGETYDDMFLCFLYKNGKFGCSSYVNFYILNFYLIGLLN
jgi:hypothetical protein